MSQDHHNHSHHHNHNHSHSHDGNATKNISVAFFLNLFFVFIEVAGGLFTNSIAILSDALHDFGDCLSLAVAYAFQKKATRKRNLQYTYGYRRYSLLGSVFLSGVLFVRSVFVIYEAAKRVVTVQEVNAGGMLWIAVAGIIINGAAALRLKKGSSLNERAVFLHIMEDVLGWVAVLIASIVMMFIHLPVLDPLLSIGISLWVLTNVYRNLRASFKIMLQATPEDVDMEHLEEELREVDEVVSVHDLHLWTMDGESHIMTLHVVSNTSNPEKLKQNIIEQVKTFNIDHVTIELENPEVDCQHKCEA
ncbi:MAG: cation diffusion facilitator family transporter [Tannerella sp.]|jgi:cobalt-zinc-cadmium efflux system protein|nr:cation diffusion facilitator family transporter [Tannerella sp.]